MNATTRIVAACLAGCLAMTTATARATRLAFEQFNYVGADLAGQDGGVGWNGGWFATAGSTSTNALSNDGVSLDYPSSFELPLLTPSVAGSRVSTGGNATNASTSRLMANTVDLSVSGNTLYVSALIRKTAANGGGVNNDNILLEFVDANGNRRFGLGIEGTTDKPWLNANGSTTPSAGPAVTPGDAYFIVAKIVSAAAPALDTAFLKVFGAGYAAEVPIDEPATWDATLTQNTGAVLDRLRIRIDPGNTGAAPGEIDEIRIGTTWGSVVPEPTSWLLSGCAFSGLAAGGHILGRRTALLGQRSN